MSWKFWQNFSLKSRTWKRSKFRFVEERSIDGRVFYFTERWIVFGWMYVDNSLSCDKAEAEEVFAIICKGEGPSKKVFKKC